MKNKEFKYTTIFSSELKPLVSEEKDKYLAMASLLEVGEFVPEIDTEKNVDLLPIAFNACVANRVNKNGDVISGETASEIYNSFINKPINLEHNRDRVVGTILTAGFSEFGTDRPLTEEEVKDIEGPYNITLGGIIWKIVSNELTDLIEETNDPTSEHYQKISASWELGFTEFHIVALEESEKNIENGEYFTDNERIEELKDNLLSFGGEGKLEDGRNIYRQVVGSVIPLGVGLTESPAAEVCGVAIKNEKEKEIEKNLSQNSENNVIEDTDYKQKDNNITMKIESLKDITEESVKTLTASSVSDFIEEQVKQASDKFVQERDAAETSLKDTEEKYEALNTESEQSKEQIEKLNSELGTLKDEIEAQKKEALFNERMASFDEEYELSDKDREVIASDIKDLDEDSFSSYSEKMSVLLRDKNKTTLAAKEEKEAEAGEEKENGNGDKEKKEDGKKGSPFAKAETVEEVEASEETQEVVDEALEEAEEVKDTVANTVETSESSTYDKYKNAFELDQFEIKY